MVLIIAHTMENILKQIIKATCILERLVLSRIKKLTNLGDLGIYNTT